MSKEQEKVASEEEKIEESKEEKEKKSEEETKKGDFEKDKETVSAGKYNQAIRKQREMEVEKRELEKKLENSKSAKKEESNEEEEDEEEDFLDEESKKELPDVSALVDEKVKPILERINQREESDKKNQRTAFFEAHPEYLTDSEKWQELLDEMDNSLNPNSKDSHYEQLSKAHRIIEGSTKDSDVDKKRREMASDSASKSDGSNKEDSNESQVDEREERMAKRMPVGYRYE